MWERWLSTAFFWLLIGFMGWLFYDSTLSPGSRACFKAGGTSYDRGTCWKNVQIDYKLINRTFFGCEEGVCK